MSEVPQTPMLVDNSNGHTSDESGKRLQEGTDEMKSLRKVETPEFHFHKSNPRSEPEKIRDMDKLMKRIYQLENQLNDTHTTIARKDREFDSLLEENGRLRQSDSVTQSKLKEMTSHFENELKRLDEIQRQRMMSLEDREQTLKMNSDRMTTEIQRFNDQRSRFERESEIRLRELEKAQRDHDRLQLEVAKLQYEKEQLKNQGDDLSLTIPELGTSTLTQSVHRPKGGFDLNHNGDEDPFKGDQTLHFSFDSVQTHDVETPPPKPKSSMKTKKLIDTRPDYIKKIVGRRGKMRKKSLDHRSQPTTPTLSDNPPIKSIFPGGSVLEEIEEKRVVDDPTTVTVPLNLSFDPHTTGEWSSTTSNLSDDHTPQPMSDDGIPSHHDTDQGGGGYDGDQSSSDTGTPDPSNKSTSSSKKLKKKQKSFLEQFGKMMFNTMTQYTTPKTRSTLDHQGPGWSTQTGPSKNFKDAMRQDHKKLGDPNCPAWYWYSKLTDTANIFKLSEEEARMIAYDRLSPTARTSWNRKWRNERPSLKEIKNWSFIYFPGDSTSKEQWDKLERLPPPHNPTELNRFIDQFFNVVERYRDLYKSECQIDPSKRLNWRTMRDVSKIFVHKVRRVREFDTWMSNNRLPQLGFNPSDSMKHNVEKYGEWTKVVVERYLNFRKDNSWISMNEEIPSGKSRRKRDFDGDRDTRMTGRSTRSTRTRDDTESPGPRTSSRVMCTCGNGCPVSYCKKRYRGTNQCYRCGQKHNWRECRVPQSRVLDVREREEGRQSRSGPGRDYDRRRDDPEPRDFNSERDHPKRKNGPSPSRTGRQQNRQRKTEYRDHHRNHYNESRSGYERHSNRGDDRDYRRRNRSPPPVRGEERRRPDERTSVNFLDVQKEPKQPPNPGPVYSITDDPRPKDSIRRKPTITEEVNQAATQFHSERLLARKEKRSLSLQEFEEHHKDRYHQETFNILRRKITEQEQRTREFREQTRHDFRPGGKRNPILPVVIDLTDTETRARQFVKGLIEDNQRFSPTEIKRAKTIFLEEQDLKDACLKLTEEDEENGLRLARINSRDWILDWWVKNTECTKRELEYGLLEKMIEWGIGRIGIMDSYTTDIFNDVWSGILTRRKDPVGQSVLYPRVLEQDRLGVKFWENGPETPSPVLPAKNWVMGECNLLRISHDCTKGSTEIRTKTSSSGIRTITGCNDLNAFGLGTNDWYPVGTIGSDLVKDLQLETNEVSPPRVIKITLTDRQGHPTGKPVYGVSAKTVKITEKSGIGWRNSTRYVVNRNITLCPASTLGVKGWGIKDPHPDPIEQLLRLRTEDPRLFLKTGKTIKMGFLQKRMETPKIQDVWIRQSELKIKVPHVIRTPICHHGPTSTICSILGTKDIKDGLKVSKLCTQVTVQIADRAWRIRQVTEIVIPRQGSMRSQYKMWVGLVPGISGLYLGVREEVLKNGYPKNVNLPQEVIDDCYPGDEVRFGGRKAMIKSKFTLGFKDQHPFAISDSITETSELKVTKTNSSKSIFFKGGVREVVGETSTLIHTGGMIGWVKSLVFRSTNEDHREDIIVLSGKCKNPKPNLTKGKRSRSELRSTDSKSDLPPSIRTEDPTFPTHGPDELEMKTSKCHTTRDTHQRRYIDRTSKRRRTMNLVLGNGPRLNSTSEPPFPPYPAPALPVIEGNRVPPQSEVCLPVEEKDEEPLPYATLTWRVGRESGEVRAMIDTGSSISIMNGKLKRRLETLGLVFTKRRKSMTGCGGNAVSHERCQLLIRPSHKPDYPETEIRVWVLPDLPEELIIGRVHHRNMGIDELRYLDGSFVHESHKNAYDIPRFPGDDEWFSRRELVHLTNENDNLLSETSDRAEIVQPNCSDNTGFSRKVYVTQLFPEEKLRGMTFPISGHRMNLVLNISGSETPTGHELPLMWGARASDFVKNEVKSLLRRFQHVIARDTFDIGQLPKHVAEFRINLKPGTRLRRQRPHRLNKRARDEVERQVKELLEHGLISRSNSEVAAPTLVVTKPGGEWRFCIDYREINKHTVGDAFPMQRIDEALEEASNGVIFSALDLKSAYWHVSIAEDQKHLSAFQTETGLYQWNVMPFGFKTAPSTFQRAMVIIFEGMRNVIVYLDDILIFSNSIGDHLNTIEEVLDRLSKHNLHLNIKKCQWFFRSIKFLGHQLSDTGIGVCPEYRDKILKVSRPRNRKELQQWSGLVNYIGKFIPNLAELAQPINRLRKSGVRWKWGEEQEKSFQRIKEEIENVRWLGHPDPYKPYILFTDASDYAIGAMLCQVQKGDLVALEFMSKTLTQSQNNWTIAEKELYSVVYSIHKWRTRLLTQRFLVLTDHRNLVWLFTYHAEMNQRMQRWATVLQEFDFTVHYIRGQHNTLADYLSRENARLAAVSLSGNEEKEKGPKVQSCKVMTFESTRDRPKTTLKRYNLRGDKDTLARREAERRSELEMIRLKREEKELRKKEKEYQEKVRELEDLAVKLGATMVRPMGGEMSQAKSGKELTEIDTNPTADKLEDLRSTVNSQDEWFNELEYAFNLINSISGDIGSKLNQHQLRKAQRKDFECRALRLLMLESARKGLTGRQKGYQTKLVRRALRQLTKTVRRKWNLESQSETEGNHISEGEDQLIRIDGHIFVPLLLRKEVLRLAHDSVQTEHPGITRMSNILKRTLYWPSMDKDIWAWIRSCKGCQMAKGTLRSDWMPGRKFRPTRRWQTVAIDLVGPLPRDRLGYTTILTIQDQFTRYIEAVPLRTSSALEVALALLQNWFLKFAIPETLLSDNGSQFSGALFQSLVKMMNVHQVWTSVAHPEANGRLERWHGYLKTRLRILSAAGKADWIGGDSWSVMIPAICSSYNTSRHENIHISPYELVFGEKRRVPWDSVEEQIVLLDELRGREDEPSPNGMVEFLKVLRSTLHEVWEKTIEQEEKFTSEQETKVKRKESPRLEVGDRVVEYTADQRLFNQKKLKGYFDGPYRIQDINGDRYTIVDEETGHAKTTQRRRLKEFIERSEQTPIEDDQSADDRLVSLRRDIKTMNMTGLLYKHRTRSSLGDVSTPEQLAKKIAEITMEGNRDNKVLELMAGSGEITKFLPPETVAIEIDKDRVKKGKEICPETTWKQMDIFSEECLRFVTENKFSVVVGNPEFIRTLSVLRLAKECLNKDGRIVLLLPTRIFQTSVVRDQLVNLGLRVVKEYQCGKWAYYPGRKKKRTEDSVFVFEVGDPIRNSIWTRVPKHKTFPDLSKNYDKSKREFEDFMKQVDSRNGDDPPNSHQYDRPSVGSDVPDPPDLV